MNKFWLHSIRMTARRFSAADWSMFIAVAFWCAVVLVTWLQTLDSPDPQALALIAREAPAATSKAITTTGAINDGASSVSYVSVIDPSPASAISSSQPQVIYFDGRPLRKVRTLGMKVTAYSPDARSCGKWADGVTASGYSVYTNGMKLVAADTRLLPFGTIITVPGYAGGQPVQVLDRGGAIKGRRLDVLYPTHEIARQWGVQQLDVDVWEYAD